MFVYIVIYIVIGLIAGIIDDESEKKKKLSFTLMIIGAIISFLTNGIFVIAAIIEMAIGYLIIVKIKSFFNKNKTNSNIKYSPNKNLSKTFTDTNTNTALAKALKDLEKKEKQRLINWAVQFNISDIIENQENIESIVKLDINNKNLTYLPSEIDCLKNLKNLNCNNNKLTSLPASIIDLHNLTELKLYNNEITSLPSNIGSMKNLSILSLSKNDLSSLPESITNLKSLKKLQLIENRLLKISENQRLWILDLILNKIDVEIDNQLQIDEKDKDINVRDILKKAMNDVNSNQSILTKSETKNIPLKQRGLRIVKKVNSEKNLEKDIVKSLDNELIELKQELKTLENRFQTLTEQKTEYFNDIEEFNTLYNLHLGELIESILNLKKEILYKQTIKQQKNRKKYEEDIEIFNSTKENIEEIRQTIEEFEKVLEDIDKNDENYEEIYATYKELQEELEKLEKELEDQEKNLSKTKEEIENDKVFEEYEDSKKQYEQFHQNYEDIKQQQADVFNITNEQKSELKKLWKKACKLCHPDIVIDKFKEKAHEIMQSLNDAYSKNDIIKVQEILSNLENGLGFEIESDNINDKEILKSKLNQYKKNILELEREIENLKQDKIYQTIQEIDDMVKYFEELKSELQSEKGSLEAKAKEILKKESVEENGDISEQSEKVMNKEISQKQSLDIHDLNDMKYLEVELTPSSYLENENEKQIRNILFSRKLENPVITLLHDYKNNYDPLAIKVFCNNIMIGFILKYKNKEDIDNFCFSNKKMKDLSIKFKNGVLILKVVKNTINKEDSQYSTYIKNIENPNFEKIRRYCNNLLSDNKADDMQKYFAENGKMQKALIYDALEQFILEFDKRTITLIDWGCNQGIISSLVLDYIKEKQLNIEVKKVILIDDNEKALSRAISHINTLSINKLEIIPINCNESGCLDKINIKQNDITINLLTNDKMPIDLFDVSYDFFDECYFMCLSNDNDNFINEIYKIISIFNDVQDLSIRNTKIGKFKKFEKIFKITNSTDVEFGEDEIPF